MTTEQPTPDSRPLRNSIRSTYDSRETGPRFWVTTYVGGRKITWRRPIADPFVYQTVRIGWPDLLRGLLRRHLVVNVIVGGDKAIEDDVLELDENYLIPGSTRRAAFNSHIGDALARGAGRG